MEDRAVVRPAIEYAEKKKSLDKKYENVIAMALQLPDGRIVTGRSSRRMVAGAALILNAVKTLCNIPDEMMLLSADIIKTQQTLKTEVLHKTKASLNVEEVLSALAMSAAVNPMAAMAIQTLSKLEGCQAHCTAILSKSDSDVFHDLGIDATCEPEFSSNNLYLS